ncbi:hypothetical protein NQ314_019851, partial [Rhamnusium bicolor]
CQVDMNIHQALSDKELENEIENFILNGFASEDDLDIVDVDDSICDPNYIPDIEKISEIVDDTLIPDLENTEENSITEIDVPEENDDLGEGPSNAKDVSKNSKKKSKYKIMWKKKNLQLNNAQLSFLDSDVLHTNILEFSTPYSFLSIFLLQILFLILSNSQTYLVFKKILVNQHD